MPPSALSLKPSASRRSRVRAFSLVELMVVVGIIALLIAILIPSISAARNSARVASMKAMLGVLDTGIATFRADHVVGGDLPPSHSDADGTGGISPYTVILPYGGRGQKTIPVSGANLLAWALVGADMQGTAGFQDRNGTGYWSDDVLYYSAQNQAKTQRSGPFVEPEKVKMPEYDPATETFAIPDQPDLNAAGKVTSVMFLDPWSQPVLYYKANPAQPKMAGIGRYLDSNNGAGVYELADNALFTGINGSNGANLGAGDSHPMSKLLDLPLTTTPQQMSQTCASPDTKDSFDCTIYNPSAPAVVKPRRADSYILLSAGPDGLYGTADDIANFDINK